MPSESFIPTASRPAVTVAPVRISRDIRNYAHACQADARAAAGRSHRPAATASPSGGGAAAAPPPGRIPARRGLDTCPAARLDTCMKSLAVRVLGDFGVDGVEPQAIGSRKARLALQLLALAEGQVVPSDV